MANMPYNGVELPAIPADVLVEYPYEDIQIEIGAGTSLRLLTRGKYCDRNIRVIATGGGSGGDGSARVIDHVVNIAAGVFITAEKYEPPKTHALYNGVRLPKIPEDVLAQYPYAWIRKHTTNGVYQLMLSATGFHFETDGAVADNGSVINPQYTFPIGDTTETAWTNANNGTYYRWSVDDARPCMWSNHDIPNGSATATDIYFKGSEPVPTE